MRVLTNGAGPGRRCTRGQGSGDAALVSAGRVFMEAGDAFATVGDTVRGGWAVPVSVREDAFACLVGLFGSPTHARGPAGAAVRFGATVATELSLVVTEADAVDEAKLEVEDVEGNDGLEVAVDKQLEVRKNRLRNCYGVSSSD